MQIAVIIPTQAGAPRIDTLLTRIPHQVDGHTISVMVVDDASKDLSLLDLDKKPGVRVVRHHTSLGIGAAAKTGCDAAYHLGFDVIALIDPADQHLSEDIAALIRPLLKSSANRLVIGTVKSEASVGDVALNSLVSFLFDVKIQDTQAAFRAFPRSLYPKIRWTSTTATMQTEMLVLAAKRGITITEVGVGGTVRRKPRKIKIIERLHLARTLLRWKVALSRGQESLEPMRAV